LVGDGKADRGLGRGSRIAGWGDGKADRGLGRGAYPLEASSIIFWVAQVMMARKTINFADLLKSKP